MNNSVSEQDFYIESEGEDEENRRGEHGDEDDDGNHSDDSLGHRRDSKVGSHNTTWPQSYRYIHMCIVYIAVDFEVRRLLLS